MADIKRIRMVYDMIESNVRSLQKLGISAEMYGSLLIPIMLAKIPEELKLIISRDMKGEAWDFEQLLAIFKSELEAREQIQSMSGSSSMSHVEGKFSRKNLVMAAVLHVSDKTAISCVCCKQQHRSQMVTNVASRRGILCKKGVCFVCLRSGHIARNCLSNMKRLKCHKAHHISICDTGVTPKVDFVNPQPLTTVNQPPETVPPTFVEENSAHTIFVDVKTSVLLQTARAVVSRPNDLSHSVNVRLILDGGSQRSYISKRLRDTFHPKSLNLERLAIKTFGSDTEELQECEVAQICVRSPSGGLNLYLNVLTVRVICSPLSGQCIELAKRKFPHLQGLKLVDRSGSHSLLDVDLLIRADGYWQVVIGQIKQGELGGPAAINTRLGWVLSGPVHGLSQVGSSSVNLSSTHVLHVVTFALEHDSVKESCPIKQDLSRFWDIESLGKVPRELSVYQKFLEHVKFTGERYEVLFTLEGGPFSST